MPNARQEGRLARRLADLRRRFFAEVWRPDLRDLSRPARFGHYLLRLVYVLSKESQRKRLFVHASALTLTTLLSLLPLAAVVLACVQVSGLIDAESFKQTVATRFPELKPLTERVFAYVGDTDFTSLGIAGIVFLGGAVLSLFTKIEEALNEVWGVRRRSFGRRLLDYTIVLILAGFVFLIASTLQIISTDLVAEHVPLIGAAFTDSLAFRFVTTVFLTLGFALLFKFMPNTRVPLWSALAAGVVCALGYELTSAAYFGLQIGVANYNMLYSSLAALPITVIWVDITWVLVLFLGEFSYLLSQITHYCQESLEDVPAGSYMEETALMVALALVRQRMRGNTLGADSLDLAHELKRPAPIVNDILDRLSDRSLFIHHTRGNTYAIHDEWEALSLQDVLDALRHSEDEARAWEGSHEDVTSYLRHTHILLKNDPSNILLKDAVNGMPA